jgi:H+-transporting ATPase
MISTIDSARDSTSSVTADYEDLDALFYVLPIITLQRTVNQASLRPEATVKRDGKWKSIDGSLVVPGDLVLLATGSAVPADCRINHGQIEVDQAALTGESLPVNMFKGDSCKMGSTVVRGEVEGTVEFTGSNTFFGRTASLLQVRIL